MPEDLTLVPTDELATEILKRFDSGMIVGLQKNFEGVGGELKDNYYHNWAGSYATLFGLLAISNNLLLKEWLQSMDKGL